MTAAAALGLQRQKRKVDAKERAMGALAGPGDAAAHADEAAGRAQGSAVTQHNSA